MPIERIEGVIFISNKATVKIYPSPNARKARGQSSTSLSVAHKILTLLRIISNAPFKISLIFFKMLMVGGVNFAPAVTRLGLL